MLPDTFNMDVWTRFWWCATNKYVINHVANVNSIVTVTKYSNPVVGIHINYASHGTYFPVSPSYIVFDLQTTVSF